MSLFVSKVKLKTEEEIELIRDSCQIVSAVLARIAEIIRPGITGTYIDREAEQFILDHQGIPAFKGYNGFPSTLCISVNDEVVHGIPKDIEFQEGDVVSVDCGVQKNGFFGDSAYSFALGSVEPKVEKLLQVTNESLYKGINEAKAGNRIGDISFAIQNFTERLNRYGVVRELVGHGIGRNLHEPPDVPNFGMRGKGIKLEPGMVIAIEPMINLGRKDIYTKSDRWTIATKDGKPSAHYEHTIVVRKERAEKLTDHSKVEANIKNNQNIIEIPINI